MPGNSLGRRSSTNPVRICLSDREDKSLLRTESRRTQTLKSRISSNECSHIPRPRMRASSCDRISIKGLKSTGKTSICHAPTTPKTPLTNSSKPSLIIGSSNKIHTGHSKGRRSLSADNASNIAVKGSRKDTRPLTDKAYQTYMLNKIDNFLAINQCSSMLNSNGSLKPVTLKMFVEISAYLVKMLDIKQIFTITNYVEELPKVAKKLHYPGIVNKSWLKTANAMHSWPNVLGWLCWLVEICEIRELAFEKYNLDNLPFVGNQVEAKINKNAFFSMLNFYNAWNDEKLDEEALMVEKYLQEIEEQQGVNEENLKIARTELEEKLLKLKAAKEDSNKIDEEIKHLQEVFLSLQNDEEKQLSDINAKEEYIKTINFETDQIKAECNILYEQICLQNTQHDELLSIIKQQPMSKIERDKILEKCTEIQNYMHQFDEHLQEIQKELYTMDIKLASINNNLTKAILTYNTEIFMHLSGDIGVNLEELKMPEKGILQPEIMEVLITKANLMNDLKELLKSQIIKKEHLLESNSNELENLQERIKILEYESSDIANKIKEKKNLMSKIKTDAKHEEAKLKEQIKNLQNDIKEIQDLMPNIQQLAAELNEAIDKLNAVQRRKMNRLSYFLISEHRNKLHSILINSNK
ncbi:hypothetical protein E2986_01124 [Frieseomelitta varia]|uniref:Kinetochore protein NDC80 n=1 Tax=Frieseomelitta varia TaxID=561572 RepID=A0A833S2R0_9HYME|nr:hypothetical protein E2986_01124 [Frieseomelitta varia]